MNKHDEKVAQLVANGYKIEKTGAYGMNTRRYKYTIISKDGRKVRVNHQGGTGGILEYVR